MNEKEQTLVRYVQKYIHGLPLGDDGFSQDALDTIILEFYAENRVDENSAIAYKGGNIERNVLERLNIPYVNLETLKCPKAKDLFKIMKEETKHIKSCGEHRLLKPKWEFDERDHCPKCEVEAYAIWFTQKCKEEAYENLQETYANWIEAQSKNIHS